MPEPEPKPQPDAYVSAWRSLRRHQRWGSIVSFMLCMIPFAFRRHFTAVAVPLLVMAFLTDYNGAWAGCPACGRTFGRSFGHRSLLRILLLARRSLPRNRCRNCGILIGTPKGSP
jgi:hypothetical protein